MKKHLYVFIILALLGLKTATAQIKAIDISGGIAVMYINQFKTFEDFRTGYNAGQVEQLAPMNLAGGFNIQLQDRVGILWLGAGFQYFSAGTSASFQLNERRDIKMNWNQGYAEIGFGKSGEKGYLYAVAAFAAGGMTMESYYTYRDGVVSYGNENPYNGVFHAISIQPFFGLKGGKTLRDRTSLQVNLLYHPAMGIQDDFRDNNVVKHFPSAPKADHTSVLITFSAV